MELQEADTRTKRTTAWCWPRRHGDREAFGELARRYERAVYATALRRLGNHAEAQEVCQEVLVRAMQKISQLREPEAFGALAAGVTNRMAINRAVRKRCGRGHRTRDAGRDLRRRGDPADSSALARERQSQVRAGLRRLGELDRDTLVAFYVQGQSLVEMSAGVPLAGRHHQAAAARRPQAAGQGARRARRGLTRDTDAGRAVIKSASASGSRGIVTAALSRRGPGIDCECARLRLPPAASRRSRPMPPSGTTARSGFVPVASQA